ncbi:Altered inheritance of mitochondria protein 24, mitochondrial [Lithohypha guttulata]|uniref:Altered inheritance of mitochondria protein 24, mitochondrial n=1 Tax=Lithohypha guttulata TaxID=1690604 RepID=A0AAN7SVJ8_9EURO|nr:Altered inheritance of mitochondria protein 24, mitochondrial [Lithohypha guttulata]
MSKPILFQPQVQLDATFEVLGSPYSMLSVTLSPSQPLHTRRGTLTGLSGDPSNVVSTLRTLNPVRRALVGIPFLYQRTTSTTPVSVLISPKQINTTLSVLQLDGTSDWKLAQRAALLAWTGSSLSITPTISSKLSLTHWGTSNVTGRGLLALSAKGHTFALDVARGESYIAHPSNILAYTTTNCPAPQPFRFRSSEPRFQIPLQLGNWFPDSRFSRALKTSNTYKFLQGVSLRIKTWSRRTIWGDRLFLRFEGPTTILLQSRGNRVNEILTSEQINEIADAPAGEVDRKIRNVRISQEDPYHKLAQRQAQGGKAIVAATSAAEGVGAGRSLSDKSDNERMGVAGSTPSAQTTKAAEETAPQVVAAESGPGKQNAA